MSRTYRTTLDDLAQLGQALTTARDERNRSAIRRVAARIPQVGPTGLQGALDEHEAPPPGRGEASTTTSL
jgi:hypothetical protein